MVDCDKNTKVNNTNMIPTIVTKTSKNFDVVGQADYLDDPEFYPDIGEDTGQHRKLQDRQKSTLHALETGWDKPGGTTQEPIIYIMDQDAQGNNINQSTDANSNNPDHMTLIISNKLF